MPRQWRWAPGVLLLLPCLACGGPILQQQHQPLAVDGGVGVPAPGYRSAAPLPPAARPRRPLSPLDGGPVDPAVAADWTISSAAWLGLGMAAAAAAAVATHTRTPAPAPRWAFASVGGAAPEAPDTPSGNAEGPPDLGAQVAEWQRRLALRRAAGGPPTEDPRRGQSPTKGRKPPPPPPAAKKASARRRPSAVVDDDDDDDEGFGAAVGVAAARGSAARGWAAMEEDDNDDEDEGEGDSDGQLTVEDVLASLNATDDESGADDNDDDDDAGSQRVWTLGPGDTVPRRTTLRETEAAAADPDDDDDDDDDEDLESLLDDDVFRRPTKPAAVPAAGRRAATAWESGPRQGSGKGWSEAPDDDDDDEEEEEDEDPRRAARLRLEVEAYLRTTRFEEREAKRGRPFSTAGLTPKGVKKEAREPMVQGATTKAPVPLRILGGRAKGKLILSPPVYVRPMMAKVREALFSSLGSLGVFDTPDLKVLDAFAGSGSVGLEALSRGAALVGFVDLSAECCGTALRNGSACGFPAASSLAVQGDVLRVLQEPAKFREGAALLASAPFDLLVATPPYTEISYPALLEAVCGSPLLGPGTVVVIEYPKSARELFTAVVGDRLYGVRNRRFGRTHLATYVYLPASTDLLRPKEFALRP